MNACTEKSLFCIFVLPGMPYVCEALPHYRLLLSTNTCTIAKSVSLVLLRLFSLLADSTQVCSLLTVSGVQDGPCCVDVVQCSV